MVEELGGVYWRARLEKAEDIEVALGGEDPRIRRFVFGGRRVELTFFAERLRSSSSSPTPRCTRTTPPSTKARGVWWMSMYVSTDLHGTRSNSDARATPAEYVRFRHSLGMKVIAVSDHDIFAAVRAAAPRWRRRSG